MMTLEELAQRVKSNFKKLTESEIVGRIMLLSGRNLERSLAGYSLLREKSLIPNDFVDKKTDRKFIGLLKKYPALADLIENLDAVPGKITVNGKEEIKTNPFQKDEIYTPPERISAKEVISSLRLPDF